MLLFTPGPTPVLEEVRLAMAAPTIHHRTPEFEAIFQKAREALFQLLPMKEVLFLASTGTGAMEAAITNIAKKKVLTINAGKFGDRFSKIVKAFNLELVELKYEWNIPASVEDVKKALKDHSDIDTIALQICESAGGLRHPVEEIAKAAKEFNSEIAIIADGITAVGVEPIDVTNIDVLITGSQKALMLPPGLAMLGLSEHALNRIDNGKGFYFNLASELKKQRQNTTAYTAATTLIIGFSKMMEIIEQNGGLKVLFEKTKKRHNALLESLRAIGLTIYPKSPALAMATIIDEKNANEIRNLLKTKYKINIAGGQDHLKGKIFRINNMGLIETYQMAWVVNSIELALNDLGLREYNGDAVRIFSKMMESE